MSYPDRDNLPLPPTLTCDPDPAITAWIDFKISKEIFQWSLLHRTAEILSRLLGPCSWRIRSFFLESDSLLEPRRDSTVTGALGPKSRV